MLVHLAPILTFSGLDVQDPLGPPSPLSPRPLQPTFRAHCLLYPREHHMVFAWSCCSRKCTALLMLYCCPLAQVASAQGLVAKPFNVTIPDQRLWWPDDPFLYDVRVRILRTPSTSSFGLSLRKALPVVQQVRLSRTCRSSLLCRSASEPASQNPVLFSVMSECGHCGKV